MNQDHLTNALILWNYHNQSEPLEKAELIVGLGSYDLRVADRCMELFDQSFAPQICFSGASGNWTSGLFETSEAAAFADRAIQLGAPENSITIEEEAHNIGENIALTRNLFPEVERVIWVTKPQTQRRVSATLDVQLSEISSFVTAPNHNFQAQPTDTHTMHDLFCEMVGDIWRIAAYPELGYMAEQVISEDVRSAYDALVAAGFTDHLPANIVTLEDR